MIHLYIFAGIFAAALLGMALRRRLPAHHVTTESKEIVLVGVGLVATMAAVVLGLLVASAKASFDKQRDEVIELCANSLLLDRLLAHYGPEAAPARELLRVTVSGSIDLIWKHGPAAPPGTSAEQFFDAVHGLAPASEMQKKLQDKAEDICTDLGHTRMLLVAQSGRSISLALVVVLVCWVAIVFLGIGLFAPTNATVVVTLLLCAAAVAGAIGLTLELDQPFSGLIQISPAPVQQALAQLGR